MYKFFVTINKRLQKCPSSFIEIIQSKYALITKNHQLLAYEITYYIVN